MRFKEVKDQELVQVEKVSRRLNGKQPPPQMKLKRFEVEELKKAKQKLRRQSHFMKSTNILMNGRLH